MKSSFCFALAGLLCASSVLADEGHPGRARDRAFRTLEGDVASIEVAKDDQGIDWVVAVLEPQGDLSKTHIRIAPREVLDTEEFSLAAGHRIKVRVFADETPYQAQRIRNQDTGRVLRLRSLRGEPLWDSGCHHYRGGPRSRPGHHGQRPDRGRAGH